MSMRPESVSEPLPAQLAKAPLSELSEQALLFADIAQEFATSLNVDETVNTAMNRFMEFLDAEAASVFLIDDEAGDLVCKDCAGPVDITGLRLGIDQGIVGRTVREQTTQMVRDVRTSDDFEESVDEDTGFRTLSVMCAPLVIRKHCIGALELLNKRSGDGLFDERDRNMATAIAAAAALAIHNARMALALVEQERLKKELELAREIQEDLLPQQVGSRLGKRFPVTGLNIPALEVSGDFYDFFALPDGRIYFNLADVSGKGMNSALLMAKTCSLLRCLAKDWTDPGKLLARVNDEICETASHGMFCTIVSGFIEPDTAHVCLANAGHQPPLVHDGSSFQTIPADAPPLGVVPGVEFPVAELNLRGASLYLFTDGVTESRLNCGKMLDIHGFMNLITTVSDVSAGTRLENIVAEIRRLSDEQSDDMTMLLIECRD